MACSHDVRPQKDYRLSFPKDFNWCKGRKQTNRLCKVRLISGKWKGINSQSASLMGWKWWFKRILFCVNLGLNLQLKNINISAFSEEELICLSAHFVHPKLKHFLNLSFAYFGQFLGPHCWTYLKIFVNLSPLYSLFCKRILVQISSILTGRHY